VTAPRQVRGVLHIHSSWSYDGELELPQLRELLLGTGYSFAGLSEHMPPMTRGEFADLTATCLAHSDDEFCFIPGVEYAAGSGHHLLIWDTGQLPLPKPGPGFLEAVGDQSRLVVAAHVSQTWVTDEILSLIDGLEIWNVKYDGRHAPRAETLRRFNELPRSGRPLPFAGLDLHRARDYASVDIVVRRPAALTSDSLVRLVRSGHFTIAARWWSADAAETLPLPDHIARFVNLCSSSLLHARRHLGALMSHHGLTVPQPLRNAMDRVIH